MLRRFLFGTLLLWLLPASETIAQEYQLSNIARGPASSAYALLASPDGRHLYGMSSQGIGEVMWWSRDETTGALEFVDTIRDPVDLAVYWPWWGDLLLSPDARQLYALRRGASAAMLLVLARDPDSGALELRQRVDLDSEQYPESLAISPDGAHLYVGGSHVLVFARQSSDGTVVLQDGTTEVSGTSGLLVSADGSFVFHSGAGHIRSFLRDPVSGEMTLADSIHQIGDDMIHDTGELFDASLHGNLFYARARVVSFSIFLSHILAAVSFDSSGQLQVEGATGLSGSETYPLDLAVDPGSGRVMVSRFEDNDFHASVRLYEPTPDGSELVVLDDRRSRHAHDLEPAAVAFSPDGKQAYVARFERRNIAVLPLDEENFSLLEPLPEYGFERPRSLSLLSDGSLLVDSYENFSELRSVGGRWQSVGWTASETRDFDSLTKTPDDRFVFTVDDFTGSTTFERNVDGVYEPTVRDGLGGGTFQIVSPDGGHLLRFDILGERADVLEIEPVTGALVSVGSESIEGWRMILSGTFTPDGRKIFLVDKYSFDEPAIGRVLDFDPETGALTDPHEILVTTEALALAPDGAHLYTISRNTATENLSLLAFDTSFRPPLLVDIMTLKAAAGDHRVALAVSPDGGRVFAYDGEGRLVSVERDSADGTLGSILDAIELPEEWLSPYWTSPFELVPEGDALYVMSGVAGTVTTLRRDILFLDGFETGDVSRWENAENVVGR